MKMKTQLSNIVGCSKSGSERKFYSNKMSMLRNKIKKEIRNISNKQPNLTLHLKKLEKDEQVKPIVSRRKLNSKIQSGNK